MTDGRFAYGLLKPLLVMVHLKFDLFLGILMFVQPRDILLIPKIVVGSLHVWITMATDLLHTTNLDVPLAWHLMKLI